ncbi:hypothetical protein BCR42DRAFT_437305 [Absidia repens]|uniref:Uncharacterized protein n=1 Tax=Absidia repens TaxID=90262 RepID=A0A1X2IKB2_9FUNG|nr:hypothetical protein BCR42DRAFT_437305 [Absidia repens]
MIIRRLEKWWETLLQQVCKLVYSITFWTMVIYAPMDWSSRTYQYLEVPGIPIFGLGLDTLLYSFASVLLGGYRCF